MELRLSDLRNGESGTITSVGASRGRGRSDGQRAGRRMRRSSHRFSGRGWGFRKRLEDMGLTPGTKVTVVKSAPFNGPLEIYVRGSRLAIGRGMAERIFVEAKR
jgi:Fe2+ transport system protein FeoA